MWTSSVQLEPAPPPLQPSGAPPELLTSTELLRPLAVATDATSVRSVGLARVWSELETQRSSVVDSFLSPQRSFLILKDRPASEKPPVRLARRQLELFEAVLLGQSQKAVAMEAGMSISSVSCLLRDTLAALGFRCLASKVPPILVALVSAARVAPRRGRESDLVHGPHRLRVISIERAELALDPLLSPAERTAVRLLIEGKHHEEIAKERGASRRTIANQLGSAFRKLGVSGRSELLAALACGRSFPNPGREARARRSSA